MTVGRFACTGLAIIALMLFTGCWDSTEIEDLAMVIGSGFDLTEDGQLEVTVQIASPKGTPSAQHGGDTPSQRLYLVLSEKGPHSCSELMAKLQKQLSSRFFYGHRSVIVFGEKFAREGINESLDLFIRAPDSRFTAYVLTTKGMTAKEVLETPYMLENIPMIAVKKMQMTEGVYSVNIEDLVSAFIDDEVALITGVIKSDPAAGDDRKFRIQGGAVYKENKLIGYLDEGETRMLMWKEGDIQQSLLSVRVQPETERYSGTVGLLMLHGSSHVDTKIVRNKPYFTIHLKGVGKIIENNTDLDMKKEESLKIVAEKFTEQAEEILRQMTRSSQKEWRVDMFNLGRELHCFYADYWLRNKENWEEIYANAEVDFKVELNIVRTGRMQYLPS